MGFAVLLSLVLVASNSSGRPSTAPTRIQVAPFSGGGMYLSLVRATGQNASIYVGHSPSFRFQAGTGGLGSYTLTATSCPKRCESQAYIDVGVLLNYSVPVVANATSLTYNWSFAAFYHWIFKNGSCFNSGAKFFSCTSRVSMVFDGGQGVLLDKTAGTAYSGTNLGSLPDFRHHSHYLMRCSHGYCRHAGLNSTSGGRLETTAWQETFSLPAMNPLHKYQVEFTFGLVISVYLRATDTHDTGSIAQVAFKSDGRGLGLTLHTVSWS